MPKRQAIIAYIPALHAGYISLFSRYKTHDLFVLSSGLVKNIPRLDRDIRALSSKYIVRMISSLPDAPSATELTSVEQLAGYDELLLPDEDVSHTFADQYLDGKKVDFIPIFLRWERLISTIEQTVPEYRKRTTDANSQQYMKQAIEESTKSPDWWRQVGAVVITKSGSVLKAHNSPMPSHDYTLNSFGDPRSNFDAGENIELSKCIHAEAKIISEAARDGVSLKDATWYVTTYACPPCAKLIATSGGKKMYYKDGYSLLDAEDILSAVDIDIILVEGV